MIPIGTTVAVINRLHRKSVCNGRSGVVVDVDIDHDLYRIRFDDDGTAFWFDSCNIVERR